MGNVLSDASCIGSAEDAVAQQEANEREMGKQAIREMITGKNETTDWAAVIRKAEELHKQEQTLVQQRQQRKQLAAEEKKRRRKELARRKKEDASGSFSVNLVTHKPGETNSVCSDTRSSSTLRTPRNDGWTSSEEHSGSFTAGSSTCDHSSRASDTISDFNPCRSCDEGMVPIDENMCLDL